MAFQAGLASLSDLRAQLGYADASTTHDTILQDLLYRVSGSIEARAGRPLRRSHRVHEFHQGGDSRVIRLEHAPIAKIHSIRESSERDFETSGNFTELTEDTDFTLEPGRDGRAAGQAGLIRRLNGSWLGMKRDPGQVRVEYTGGYKTDDEVALENATVNFAGTSQVMDYGVQKSISGGTFKLINQTDAEVLTQSTASIHGVMLIRFDVSSMVPDWKIYELTLTIGARYKTSSEIVPVYFIEVDPRLLGDLSALHGAYADDNAVYLSDSDIQVTSATLVQEEVTIDSSTDFNDARALIERTIRASSFIGMSISGATSSDGAYFAASENADATMKPTLTITHGLAYNDAVTVPDELRNAAIIQATHEFKHRANPGGTAGSTSGGASGTAGSRWAKGPIALLPEVAEIADSYSRLY